MVIRLWKKGVMIGRYYKADRLTHYDNKFIQIDYLDNDNKQSRASYYPSEYDTIEVKEEE